jgi:hypothetical protein
MTRHSTFLWASIATKMNTKAKIMSARRECKAMNRPVGPTHGLTDYPNRALPMVGRFLGPLLEAPFVLKLTFRQH